MTEAHIRLADKKGFLQGDLNVIQQEALQWLMIKDAKDEAEKFDTQLRFMVLSGMNPQLYKTVWPQERDESEIQWVTPSSTDEARDLESLLAELDSLSDSEKIEIRE